MKTIRYFLMTTATMVSLASTAFSQSVPDGIEAGVGESGLPLGQVRPMTVESAKRLVAVAKESACAPPAASAESCSGAFVVVDDAGVPVFLEIIDGVLAGGPELAIRKAKTSALWRRPTQLFKDAVEDKRNTSYADGTFPDMTTSPGGIPLMKNGRVVGGFAVAAVGLATQQVHNAVLAEATKIFGEQ